MRSGISVSEGQSIVLDATPPLGSETVATRDALGRVLTETICAERTLPPADNSAMDGFALRYRDTEGASAETPVRLRVVSHVPAGATSEREIGSGEAARILTGAPIPPGADCVIRQEDTEAADESVEIRVEGSEHQNIRPAGEDVRAGEKVLAPGTRLEPPHLGFLASIGRSFVAVHQRPRVAILSGGDELVEPDGDPRGGRIVSSNSYSLAAQCRALGAEPVYLGIARDDPADLERCLRSGLRADVLVSSAGVSVGDHDYVRPVLEKLGCRLEFWGVEMKPGYPIAFGRFPAGDGPLVFGLPGNPVSAMVTFEQFVRPALRKLMGHASYFRPLLEVTLGEPMFKKAGRLHFVRVRLQRHGTQVTAHTAGNQSSGALRSMVEAQGLLVFPAEATELREGDRATVQLLDEGFLQSEESGV